MGKHLTFFFLVLQLSAGTTVMTMFKSSGDRDVMMWSITCSEGKEMTEEDMLDSTQNCGSRSLIMLVGFPC